MQYLKITCDNITHKFITIPETYEALDGIIQKSFQKNLQTHTLWYQSTPVTNDADYSFLLQQNKSLKLTLKPFQPKSLKSKSIMRKGKN